MSQPIWLNSNIKINNSFFIRQRYVSKDIYFINDLFSENNFLTYEQFQRKYEVNTNYLEFYSILNAIPKPWKRCIIGHNKLDRIDINLIDKLSRDIKPCKYFYKLYIDIIKELPLKVQQKWGNILQAELDDWDSIFKLPFIVTKNTKLQNFQFKLCHRILAKNSFDCKCGIKESELCTFCNETKESLVHIFCECLHSKNVWLYVKNLFQGCGFDMQVLSIKDIIFGVQDYNNTIQHIILIVKYYIYKNRCCGNLPTNAELKEYIKYCIKIEKLGTQLLSPAQREYVMRKWLPLETVLGD